MKLTPDNSSGFKKELSVGPLNTGILDGLKFSVKDVINVANEHISFGSPLWEQTHPKPHTNAICVNQLLLSGAFCSGIAIAGELGCGSAGTNHFYGTPLNHTYPEYVPGGSSSGSAATVASGAVDFAIATDAGGSIRLPASFCGLYGMRPTHDRISMAGVLSTAPSLDTVGVIASNILILEKVMQILLGDEEPENHKIEQIFILEELYEIADKEVNLAFDEFITYVQDVASIKVRRVSLKEIDKAMVSNETGISDTFHHILCSEVWASLSSWIKDKGVEFGKNSYVDFSYMENLDKKVISTAYKQMNLFNKRFQQFLKPGTVICLPTTPFAGVKKENIAGKVNQFDYQRLRPFVSISSIAKLPQITFPLKNIKKPIGISLIGGKGEDMQLIEFVKTYSRS